MAYATEEVERLTKVLDEQNSLLQASQEQAAQKDVMIQSLQQKVRFNYLNTEQMLQLISEVQRSHKDNIMTNERNSPFVTGATAARSC